MERTDIEDPRRRRRRPSCKFPSQRRRAASRRAVVVSRVTRRDVTHNRGFAGPAAGALAGARRGSVVRRRPPKCAFQI